ncbi:30S ribosomal protein S12 methylthiotransferase RimO [Lachnospiraceae bacterium HCP1S3_C3]|nr:30S ribosomal protein S12 methylthiotransferase RimO [Lachnospiraceae bacterium]
MKILFISLGCDKNLVDTEEMLGTLCENNDISFTDDEMEADVIIINTCCFVNDAKEESINTIIEMAEHRTHGRCRSLIVAGCLAQRYKSEILKEIPEVDAVIGTASTDAILDIVNRLQKDEDNIEVYNPLDMPVSADKKRILTTGGHYAFLKIAEGCNKCCSYCVIPSIRGKYRSIPMEQLVHKAQELADGGVKELILVAQETTMYGVDLYNKKMLPELLEKLCAINGLYWIRILYCYPEEITDELIQVIKNQDKICNYLDIPVQHAADNVLKNMKRRATLAQLTETIGRLRKEIPDIVLRTTLISGFPGETEEDHEILKKFVEDMRFDRLGVFAYSPEEGTEAAEMENQVDENIKEERRDELMSIQQDIAFEMSESRIGREMLVMIEGKLADENAYVGRTYMDAPGVDGNIFITTDADLMTGDFVKVKVTGAVEYDLIGEIL